ncbi:DUF4184 family protein [Bacillus sp. ISL-47]|uniref:DUF4184 family protein n=1 Tax=Bacillus sp. ISL-47 TaxID=2819130 RepID=UPI001BE5AF5E|nr:DUF4184 family protein [Bacillus sp. ISL-47]MBT2687390.1 DUF4184 family protein [Bacillus sp. ISL-47]MBT2707148.1 DUF4184 family protein [Pseudomonas sp. ISL-84]
MPLTFAHPAAILAFSRKSRYVHFSAMVLGSMAPDFEYFLRGQPIAEIGHSFTGFILFNLPLAAIIYLIYHHFVHQILVSHLPFFLQDTYTYKTESNPLMKIIVFCYSALFGMLTHVVWDSFTHMNGYMVLKFPVFFTYSFNIYGFSIPLYKFLQHGSTILGITAILGYMYYRAMSQRKHNHTNIHPKQKVIFWSSITLLTLLFLILWQLLNYVPINSYGILVVRMIDSFFISLLTVSLVFKKI